MEEYFEIVFMMLLIIAPTFLSGWLCWKAGLRAGRAEGKAETYETIGEGVCDVFDEVMKK